MNVKHISIPTARKLLNLKYPFVHVRKNIMMNRFEASFDKRNWFIVWELSK